MLDLNSRSALTDRINFLMDAAITADAGKEPPRDYLGCSAIGGDCEMAVQYEALTTVYRESCRCTPEPGHTHFPPRVRRIFARGHLMEDEAGRWIRQTGFLLNTVNPITGGQFEVSFLGGKVRGHTDGLLTMWLGDCPSPVELPALWECKCLAHKYVMAARRDHIRKSHPKYYGQMMLYMGGLRLKHGLITCVDADTMDIYHELVDFDEETFDMLIRRAEHVLAMCEAGEMVPRCATTRASVTCRLCHWAEVCWSEA